MYNEIAKGYNELHKREQLNKLKLISSLIEIKATDRLLDIGCGTGISTNYFKCKSYGVDPSREMIKEGEGNLVYGLAEKLPFKDKNFDIIISITAFHNFSDFNKAINEIKRVAKKNCKLVITVLKKSNKLNEIKELLLKNFKLKEVEESKDMIFYGKV